jgi:hypothetical protein
MLPDEEGGVADVGRCNEADQCAIARVRRAAQRREDHAPLAHAALPVEQPHAHLGSGIASRVAVANLPGDRFWGQTRFTRRINPLIRVIYGVRPQDRQGRNQDRQQSGSMRGHPPIV